MSELTNGQSPESIAASDHNISGSQTDSEEVKGVETDVPDVKADGEKQGLPVFNVDKDEFYQNMKHGRKRLRFKSGSSIQQYMQKTQYQRPFWISHNDNGQVWTRKVK